MAIQLKVVTTTEFPDEEAFEHWLKNYSPFKPNQALELLDNKKFEITESEEASHVGTSKPTHSVFTIEEV